MSSVIPEIRVYSPSEVPEPYRPKSVHNRSGVDDNGFRAIDTTAADSATNRCKVFAEMSDSSKTNTSRNTTGGDHKRADPVANNAANSVPTISWDNTFHMRNINLMNFGTNSVTNRSTYRSHAVSLHRQRMGGTTSSAKSLNILRQTLQPQMNREINEVIQRYLDRFFRPAMENIRNNNGANSVSEQHIQAVCRQILDESKKMYFATLLTRSNSPAMSGVSAANGCESDNENNNPIPELIVTRPVGRPKRVRDSDSDSEAGSLHTLKPIGRKKGKHSSHHNSGRSWTPIPVKAHHSKANKSEPSDAAKRVVRDSRKWDPNRLSTETKFVLGSRANKALGFGTTRGRLYTKHADLFRYIGDQEDKQWLHDNHLMPPAGGRAYLLIKEDILDLIESEEYKGAPGVNANDMGEGFTVPESMITKMATIMDNMRNSDMSRKKIETKSRTIATNNTLMSLQAFADNSNTTQSNDTTPREPSLASEPPSVSRPESGAVSPADELEFNVSEMPSADPSPFSIGASCFESDVSPNNDNPVISPIPSDISTNTMNDI